MDNVKRYFFTPLLFVLLSFGIRAAEAKLPFLDLSKRISGVPSIVNDLVRGKGGHIWMATQYGLLKYNGYQFRRYLSSAENKLSLAHNNIQSLALDSSGDIWIATYHGLSRYNIRSDTFTNFYHSKADPSSLLNNKLAKVFVDSKDRVWVGTWSSGLSLYQPETNTFTHFKNNGDSHLSLANNSVRAISEDENGFIWIGTSSINRAYSGLHRINPENNSIVRFESIGANKRKIDFYGINTIIAGGDKALWLGTVVGGLVQINLDNYTVSKVKLPGGEATSVLALQKDGHGGLWLGTNNQGLINYKTDKTLDQYLHDSSPYSINGNTINGLLIVGGQLWISNGSHGINVLNTISQRFQWLVYSKNKLISPPPRPVILGMAKAKKGDVWLANMNQGLLRWRAGVDVGTVNELPAGKKLGASMVQQVFVGSGGKVWVGTKRSGLYRIDPKTKVFHQYSIDGAVGSTIGGNSVRALAEHPKGTLWVASNGVGVDSIDIASGTAKRFVGKNSALLATDYNLNSIFFDSLGKLWLGTKSIGALEINVVNGSVIQHKVEANNGGISNNYISGIVEDSTGAIWLSSNAGLDKIERSTHGVEYTQLRKSIPSFTSTPIASLQMDKNENIWFSFKEKLARFNPVTYELNEFDLFSGSKPGGYVDGVSLEGDSGELYFGGIGGLVHFNPLEVDNYLGRPTAILDELYISNVRVDVKPDGMLVKVLAFNESIAFSHLQSHFGFSFSTDDFSNPLAMRYRYRMLGYSKDWVETDADNRRATYTNLNGGQYELQVQASINGLWQGEITRLNIVVLPPPWQTWWAYLLYTLLISLVAANFIWQRYKIFQEMKLRSQAIDQRNKQLSLTSSLFQNTSEGVWISNYDNRYLAVNSGFEKITGYLESEVIGKEVKIIQGHRGNENFAETLIGRVKDGSRWQGEIWNTRKNGVSYPMEIVIDRISIRSIDGSTENQFVGVFSDITERRRAEEELRKMTFFDALTQLPNRNQFQALVESSIAQCQAAGVGEFLILFFDLDHFKNINDSLGHAPGDEVLVYVATKLERFIEKPIVAARIGGDEFAVLVPPQAIDYEAFKFSTDFLDKTQDLLRDSFVAEKFQFNITASIGAAIYPHNGSNFQDLFRSADTAMHVAKNRGRDQYQFYSKDMNERARQRLDYENELRQAISKGEMEPYFQAKANLQQNCIEGVEVLARWNSEKFGWVSPEVFISLAEETRHIDEISEFLLRQACATILPAIEANVFSGRMAFNLSAAQFGDRGLVKKIDTILSDCRFPGEYFELEVTESLMMSDISAAIRVLSEFRDRGIHIALDDFGTGYSSLSYLKKLPLDVLKVDRSFIVDIVKNTRDRNMVASIIDLSHDLNLKVVAEGVEDKEQMILLKDMGCDILQGYHLSKPLCQMGYRDFIDKHKVIATGSLEQSLLPL